MRSRLVVLVGVVALLVAACGARGDVEAGDEIDDNSSGGTAAPTADDGMFGTVESPCGPTPEGMELTASDQGVTEDSITVATISDPGGPVPGLNQGIFNSMDAFAEWCNDQGGINGRELIVEKLDAAVLQYRERVLEACDTAFAMVGGGGTLDQLGAQEMVDCGLVDVAGFTVSPEKAASERVFQPQPNPIDRFLVGAAQWMAEEDPEAVEFSASIYTDVETIRAQQAKQQQAYEQVGFEYVYETPTNINEANWAPTVVAMRNAGVEYVTLTSSYEEGVNLLKAMSEQGFEPTFVDFETNFYRDDFPEAAGGAAEGTLVRVTIVPFEEADSNPATQQYLDILRKTNGDNVQLEMLGVQSFSAGLLFATAVNELGADVTREGLLEELATIDSWDGGGLHGPNDVGNNEGAGCFALMRVVGDGFEKVYPEEPGLDCGDENVVDVDADLSVGASE